MAGALCNSRCPISEGKSQQAAAEHMHREQKKELFCITALCQSVSVQIFFSGVEQPTSYYI
jgi:hypothetical protein